MDNNEYYDFEGRRYINPTLSRDEQLGFINNLRDTQGQEMAKIARDTHNLGTDVPSTLGGLSGAEGVWNKQYVAPRTNAYVDGLKSAAQAQALNEALNNYQSQLKQKYNEAYRAYNKRKLNYANGNNGNNDTTGDEDVEAPDPEYENTNGNTREQGNNDFWEPKLGKNNDVVNYGLYQLKRRADESDEEWEAHVEEWFKEVSKEHEFGNVPAEQYMENMKRRYGTD